MKRTLSLIFALLMALSSLAFSSVSSFGEDENSLPKLEIQSFGNAWINMLDEKTGTDESFFNIVASNNQLYSEEYTWNITFNGANVKKTITLKAVDFLDFTGDPDFPSEKYPEGIAIYRFQPCNQPEENRFVPVGGTNYKITVEVLKNGTPVMDSIETSGFTTMTCFFPIVHDELPDVDPVEPEPSEKPSEKPSVKPEEKPSEKPTEEAEKEEENKPAPETKKPFYQSFLFYVILGGATGSIAVVAYALFKKKKN